jgi:ATP synthase protein I
MLENGVHAMTANDKKERKEALSALATYGTIGIEMGVSLAIGLGIGYAIDHRFGTSPIFTLVFMMFGLISGMRRLYSLWKKIEKENERDDGK